MTSERSVLRIGEVARRTGVGVPTLRAWERRYGLLHPGRTEGGHRLYREDDVGHVRAMLRLLGDGWSAGAAAREVLRAPAAVTGAPAVPVTGSAAADLVERLERAFDAFDGASADLVIDDVFARLDIPRALDEVLLPVLRGLGDGWEDDARVIAREHFASNTIRPRLQRLLRGPTRSGARSCLAAAPEGEDHDLGLLAGASVAADAGWRIHYLGARMPTNAIERSVSGLHPDVVLVGAIDRAHAEAFLRSGPQFEHSAVVLGGAGFVPDDADRLRAAVHHGGPMRELVVSLERAVAGNGAI